MFRWRSIAATAAAIGVVLASKNAQDTPNLGNLLANHSELSTFYGYIQKYPSIFAQLPSYNGVTVLAPNNDAFDKVASSSLSSAFQNSVNEVILNVLEYHILQGTRLAAQLIPGAPVFIPTLLKDPSFTNVTGGQVVENLEQSGDLVVFVSGQGTRSELTTSDLLFDGGVVQVINALLIPPTGVADTANSFNVTAFEGALYTSGIIGAAQAAPDVTIFAAANSGFQALGPAITSMTSQELTKVLDYTILPQVVYSTELTGGAKFRTLNGENITITAEGNNVYVDSAQLIQTDILIANGVMHIIDNVLNPQAINNPPNPKIGTQVPVFASASMVTDLPFTNSVPCTSCQASTIVSNSEPTTPAAANASGSPTSLSSSSSKARAAIAKETGFGAVGIMAALGGVVLMV